MIKACMVIALVAGLTYSQSLVNTTLFGGLAQAVGKGSSDMNPGFGVALQPVAFITQYVAVGGHIDYSWITVKKPAHAPADFGMGVHFWDVALVPQAVLPINGAMGFTLEVDPGFYVSYAYLHYTESDGYGFLSRPYSDSDFEEGFCLTSGFTYYVNIFKLAFHYKTVYTKDDKTSWIKFSVGIDVS